MAIRLRVRVDVGPRLVQDAEGPARGAPRPWSDMRSAVSRKATVHTGPSGVDATKGREREEAGSTGPDSARNVDVCTDQEGTRGPARGDVDGMRTDKSSPAAQSLSGAAELSAKFGCKQPVVFLLGGAKPSSAYVGCCCNLKRKFAELRGSGLLDMTRDRGPWKIRAVAHGFPNENVAKAFQMLLESKCRSSGVSKKLRVMRELTEDFSAISGEPRAGDAGRSASRWTPTATRMLYESESRRMELAHPVSRSTYM
eukprot:tig00021071_g17958.t1